jgi:predicted permease
LAFPADTLPFWLRFHADWRMVGYTLGVTGITTLAFGLGPALWGAKHGPANGLMAGSRAATHAPRRGKLAGTLVGVQVAVSLVLVVAASLLANALRSMRTTDLGYEPRGLLTTDVEPRAQRYISGDARRAYFASLAERIQAIPGVRRVTGFDLWGSAPVEIVRGTGLPLDHAEAPVYTVLPKYFETLQIPIVAGTALGVRDALGAAPAAVVNARFARRYWPGESPVGRRIRLGAGGRDTTWLTIVGVVGDMRRNPADLEWEPHIYVSAQQFPPRRLQLLVRTRDGTLPARALSDAATALDPDEPLGPILTMERQIGAWTAASRFFAIALSSFGLVALLIAVAGVYGVVAGGVVARTREFGIRLALGATPSDIVALAVRRGARLSAVGAGIGLVGAIAVSQVLVTLPFGVERLDAGLVATTALALIAIALLAAYAPARRAGRVEATVALADDT